MRSILLGFLIGFGLAGPATPAPAPRDTLIVPGERVGPLALGMTATDLAGAVGTPPQALQQGKDTVYSWGDVTAQISEGASGVDVITVNDPRYETSNHIRVGLASLAATAVLGQPAKRTGSPALETLDYEGLTVVVRNNLIAQIRVRK
jgi:hypothetical protein